MILPLVTFLALGANALSGAVVPRLSQVSAPAGGGLGGASTATPGTVITLGVRPAVPKNNMNDNSMNPSAKTAPSTPHHPGATMPSTGVPGAIP
jgi:hypothetical protein